MDSYQLCAHDTYTSRENMLIILKLASYLLPFSHSHSVILEVMEAGLESL